MNQLTLRGDLLGSEDKHSTVPTVLPQGMKEGNGCTMQEGWAPVSILLLGVNQLQHHVEAAPHTKAEFLQEEQAGIQVP